MIMLRQTFKVPIISIWVDILENYPIKFNINNQLLSSSEWKATSDNVFINLKYLKKMYFNIAYSSIESTNKITVLW